MAQDWRLVRVSENNPIGSKPFYDEGVVQLINERGRVVFEADYFSGGIKGHTAAPLITRSVGSDNEIYQAPTLKVPALALGYGDKILHQDLGAPRVSQGCICLTPEDMGKFINVYNSIPEGLEPTKTEVVSGKGFFGSHSRRNDRDGESIFSGLFKKSENEPKRTASTSSRHKDNDRNNDDDKRENNNRHKNHNKSHDSHDDKKGFGEALRNLGKKLKEGGGEVRESNKDEPETTSIRNRGYTPLSHKR